MEAHMGCYGFSSPLTASEEFSDISTSFMTVDSNDFTLDELVFPSFSDDASLARIRREQSIMCLEGSNTFTNPLFQDTVEETTGWIDEYNLSLTSQQSSNEERSASMPFNSSIMSSREGISIPFKFFPGVGTETDRDLGVFHLLKAYGEAKANESVEFARVIQRRLGEKVSSLGTTMERLGHYLLQGLETKSNYLIQESLKNYASAFKAFYEICPYDRFAHFAANTAILESVPNDVNAIHIIDFDVGGGVQWPPLLAVLGPQISVRLTCMNHMVDGDYTNLPWRFEKTKEYLCSYASSMGLNLKVDEMWMEELMFEMKSNNKANCKEWLVFNCMAGLPHMGVLRSRTHVMDFTRLAGELIAKSTSLCTHSTSGRNGILTFGSGCGLEIGNHMPYSDGHLLQSHALFESLEWHFPPHLSLARTAMECLFLGPCVSSIELQRNWELMEGACEISLESRLEGCNISKHNLFEAREMVNREGSHYAVEVGCDGKEIVLEWKTKPLVRARAWRI